MRKKILWSLFASFLFIGTALAQNLTINGKVTDEKGDPISGASVQVKGTRTGTTVNTDGSFTLKAANGASLVVSALGYESKTVAAAANITVKLAADVKSLSEVVVTGSGVATSKRKLGISVESVTADKLPAAPSASIDQALVGKIPGASISSISGNPGDPVNIILRGINTVQGGTKPMILLDGIEIRSTDIQSLDLSNVDRVEVVQGAASASIYGAQGANGVIQIFSKKGKRGTTQVNVSSSYATNELLNVGNFNKSKLNPYLHNASGELVSTDGTVLQVDPIWGLGGSTASKSIAYQFGGAARYGILNQYNYNHYPYTATVPWYDHFAQMFQQGYTMNNALNISGGSDKSDFAISVSNNKSKTSIMTDVNGGIERTNLTANIGTELFKNFRIRSITQLVYTKNNMAPGLGFGSGGTDGNSLGSNGQVYSFLNTSPFFDLKAIDPVTGQRPANQYARFLSVNGYNPFYQATHADAREDKVDVIQNFEATYKINKFVDVSAKYGLNYRSFKDYVIYPNQTAEVNGSFWEYWAGGGNDNSGQITAYDYTSNFKNFLGTINVKTDFEKDFGLKIPLTTNTQLGFDHRKQDQHYIGMYGNSLPVAPPINFTSTQTQAIYTDYKVPFVTYGFLVNQKFDYSNYLGLTAGVRSDYSSTFGAGSKPFTFPHADLYLLPSQMDWWKGKLQDVVPFFKLRAAYGEAGIQPGPFDRYPVLNQQPIGSNVTYAFSNPTRNPNLNVEVSKETEFGTDFTINTNSNSNWLKSINASFTYWKRSSANVIYSIAVPLSTGASGILDNAIDMSSHGTQFSLNMPIFSSKNLTWDFTTNYGTQVSMIDKITGGATIPLTSAAGSTNVVLVAGKPIGQIYAYPVVRSLDQKRTDGTAYFTDAMKASGRYVVVKDPIYGGNVVVDTLTKGAMIGSEQLPLGDPSPKFNMSFINNITYKDFINLNFQFDWINGSHLYNQTKEWMYRDGISNDFDKVVNIPGFTPAAWTAYHASFYYALWGSTRGVGNNVTKDYFLEDASFVRLRNISLSIDLAKTNTFKKFRKLQLVFTGRNIMTWTKYTGMDPEISSGSVNSSFDRGIDHSTIPNTKSYQIGLNIGF